ncbi:MAG: hypothetical protein UW73_C0025G0022 [Microgenomates group bacterium GW2011_GWB1_44_8]|nr:MAG: hypothetical protein UW73_C0025G0022 [Microgenomates group bacterium GW2011_GWB1_44_8]
MTDRLKVIPGIEEIVEQITPETLFAALNALAGNHRTSQAIARSGLTVEEVILLTDFKIKAASRTDRGMTWVDFADANKPGIGKRMIAQINKAVSSAIIPAIRTTEFIKSRRR